MASCSRVLQQLVPLTGWHTPSVARLLTSAGTLEETQAALPMRCHHAVELHHAVLYPLSMLGAQHSSLHTSTQISQQDASPVQQPQQAEASLHPQQQHDQQKESIERIRARIFGEPIRRRERTGRRVLARPLQGAQLASWYFLPPRMPGTHNEEREYVMLRKLNKRQKKQAEDAGAASGKKRK